MYSYSPKTAINSYSKVSMETGVLAADPHQLIMLLFDGAIKAITNATQYLAEGNIAEKGRSITHAISIIESGLRASLNKKVGGELAENLDKLYGYMTRQLAIAHCENNTATMTHIKNLLLELRDAWAQIAPAKNDQVEQVKAAPVDALAPRNASFVSA